MNALGKAALNHQISNASGQASAASKYATTAKSGINWNDFNYPPLIKVIHYNKNELSSPHRGVAFMLWVTHASVVIISLLNLLNNIIQVAGGSAGVRLAYSFIFLIMYNPLAGITFYKGLRAFLEEENFLAYKGYAAIMCISCLVFSIAAFANFNGFVRIGSVSALPAILCVIESLMLLLTAALNGLLIFKAVKWDSGPAQILDLSAQNSVSKERTNSSTSQP